MFSLASSLLINSIFSPIDTERFSLLKDEGPFQSDSLRENLKSYPEEKKQSRTIQNSDKKGNTIYALPPERMTLFYYYHYYLFPTSQ